MTPNNASGICYAVLLHDPERERSRYAIRDGAPALFLRRKDAAEFRDELAQHGLAGAVIKVRQTIVPASEDP